MTTPLLSKVLINRFLQKADYEIKILNGYIKEAQATVTYANGRYYQVRVRHVPQALRMYGGKDEISFYVPDSKHSGVNHPHVPEELSPVVERLTKMTRYTPEEILDYKNSMNNAVNDYHKMMNIQ